MKHYTDELSLRYDPFAPAAKNHSFFGGAGRDELLERLVEQAHYGAPISAVCGPLGAGKSVLGAEFRKHFSEEALCIPVHATLFMNQSQFLEAVLQQLPFGASSPEPMDIVEDLCHFAEKMYLEAKTLILVIDDAHELASEVLEIIETLIAKVSESAVHVLLLGENQLSSLLHNALSVELAARMLEETLVPLSNEDAIQYVAQKLEEAGYTGSSILDSATIGYLVNESNGMPGKFNARVADALSVSIMKPDAPVAARHSNEAMPWSSLGKQYWITASALLVLLIGALMYPSAEEGELSAAAADSVSDVTQRINVPVNPVNVTANDQTDEIFVDPQAGRQARDEESLPSSDSTPELAQSASDATNIEEVNDVVESSEQEQVGTVELVQQESQSTNNTAEQSPDLAAASEFEQALLAYPAENFTVQIMGSRSEDNVKQFVASELGALNHGYFESRYQEQPWFVVVMGNFVSREAATRALGDLPGDIRELNPWIRSLTDVQSDIRRIRGLN